MIDLSAETVLTILHNLGLSKNKRYLFSFVATVLPMRGGALTKRSRTLTAGAPGT